MAENETPNNEESSRKFFVGSTIICGALGLLLVEAELEGVRMIFIALSWISLVMYVTKEFLPNGWMRDATKIALLILGLPSIAIMFSHSGEGVRECLTGKFVDNSLGVVQGMYHETTAVIPGIFRRIFQTGDIQQFNGNVDWVYLLVALSILFPLSRLLFSAFGAAKTKAAKAKVNRKQRRSERQAATA